MSEIAYNYSFQLNITLTLANLTMAVTRLFGQKTPKITKIWYYGRTIIDTLCVDPNWPGFDQVGSTSPQDALLAIKPSLSNMHINSIKCRTYARVCRSGTDCFMARTESCGIGTSDLVRCEVHNNNIYSRRECQKFRYFLDLTIGNARNRDG